MYCKMFSNILMCIQCTYIHSIYLCMKSIPSMISNISIVWLNDHSLTDWLVYPKSRDAVASKKGFLLLFWQQRNDDILATYYHIFPPNLNHNLPFHFTILLVKFNVKYPSPYSCVLTLIGWGSWMLLECRGGS